MKAQEQSDDLKTISPTRVLGLVRKESFQIIRDPSSIGIAFVLPVLLLLLFGYGVSLDARHVQVAVVIEKSSPQALELVSGFRHSDYFAPVVMRTVQEAEHALMAREIDAIIWLKNDFARKILSRDNASIGVIVNGVDANKARIIEGYVNGVWLQWLKRHSTSVGQPLNIPVTVDYRIWFNPAVRSRNFLVPGLIAVIMTLIGAMLTAMVVAREWERGTMEALLVTPVSIQEIILGKIIPYFLLGMGGMALSVIMAVWVFSVPFAGSFTALVFASSIFMLTAICMGLLISVAAKNQFVAGQVAIVITFLPAFILSGFIFDLGSMPILIQWFTHLVAARYLVAILQSIFLAGDIWPIFVVNSLWLLAMGLIFLMIIWKKTSKRLE